MRGNVRRLVVGLFIALSVGCGGGGSKCPDDAPLACEGGTCCPRGYPYSCGNGLCYEYGCPYGSPQVGICQLKVAATNSSKGEREVPLVRPEEAGASILLSEPQ